MIGLYEKYIPFQIIGFSTYTIKNKRFIHLSQPYHDALSLSWNRLFIVYKTCIGVSFCMNCSFKNILFLVPGPSHVRVAKVLPLTFCLLA